MCNRHKRERDCLMYVAIVLLRPSSGLGSVDY